MRTRSPSSAPPVIGLDGSTATTPTDRPAALTRSISDATSVDLPEPGGPVIPTRCARPAVGYSRRMAASATAVRFSTAVSSRASARRSPPTAALASSSPRAVGSTPVAGAASRTGLVPRPGVGPQELGDLGDGRARSEDLGDAGLLEGRDVVVRDDPSDRDQHVVEAL